jgi:hypothetical protein
MQENEGAWREGNGNEEFELSSESMLGHHKYDCYESPSASQLNQL